MFARVFPVSAVPVSAGPLPRGRRALLVAAVAGCGSPDAAAPTSAASPAASVPGSVGVTASDDPSAPGPVSPGRSPGVGARPR
ncbi:hypothetical protein K353_01388 [Kitasatospora sp. SolWspMP-SS2h]|nr:hypothetical protein K353_01388 [Kitasatospora sp. SolWspMP-SS2h]